MIRVTVALIGLVVLGLSSTAPQSARAQSDRGAEYEKNRELGLQHATAWDLYQTLKEQADGGEPLTWDKVPDWSGLYTRVMGPFDSDQPRGALPTATLTPEFEARLLEKIQLADEGREYDPISDCSPPGYPRWLHIPFLREFMIAPHQTLLISEVVNSIRRIYTDGRGHPPEEDRYPLYYGDSIGFWDDGRLIIHTNQLREGAYTRRHPDYTEQVETVEIWQKMDDGSIEASVWVYDPPALAEPWYVRQRYEKLTNDDKRLRIRYWHCGESQNNEVYETEDGSSQFRDFSFTEMDDDK